MCINNIADVPQGSKFGCLWANEDLKLDFLKATGQKNGKVFIFIGKKCKELNGTGPD